MLENQRRQLRKLCEAGASLPIATLSGLVLIVGAILLLTIWLVGRVF